MRYSLLTAATLLLLNTLSGQAWEYRGALYTGLFSFTGAAASRSTVFFYRDDTQSGYTWNPYGSLYGPGYGASASVQRAGKRHLLMGAELGYEVMKSRSSITRINGYTGTSTYRLPAKGETTLTSSFINLHPFAGYRLAVDRTHFDFTGGLDFGINLSAREKAEATTGNGATYKTSREISTILTDVRLRVQVAAGYKKAGLFASYAAGLGSYDNRYLFDDSFVNYPTDCSSSLFRFGITYQLN